MSSYSERRLLSYCWETDPPELLLNCPLIVLYSVEYYEMLSYLLPWVINTMPGSRNSKYATLWTMHIKCPSMI